MLIRSGALTNSSASIASTCSSLTFWTNRKVLKYWTLNPRTIWALIASLILYECTGLPPKIISVVNPVAFMFSAKIGVPVNPNICTSGNALNMCFLISPKLLLWHSSMMKITLSLFCSTASTNLSFLQRLLIFWIVVVIIFVDESLNALYKSSPLSILTTASFSNELKFLIVCLSKSLLSTKKTTLLYLPVSLKHWASLNDVNVLPLPVVCQTNPLFLVFKARSIKPSTAQTWYGLKIIKSFSDSFKTM